VITVLSTSALTVHNDEHGDITCTLGPSSPHLGDYHLGDHVGIACAGGVLVKIVRLTRAECCRACAAAAARAS